MSEDLIAFLRARLDEDESALRAIQDNSEPWRGEWAGDEANFALRTRNGWSLARAVTVEAGFPPGVLAHIVRHDPARMLRDIEADRKLLALLERDVTDGRERDYEATEALEQVVRIRAERFSDHPDYRPSWKP